MSKPEHDLVEAPFLAQLAGLRWHPTVGTTQNPAATHRTSFREVFLESELRTSLRDLNPGPDGKPWLDDARIDQAIAALQRIGTSKLLEANQKATQKLLSGHTVDGLPDWDGGRDQLIRYIDWDNPSKNTFRAVSQFRVDLPGGQVGDHIVPDIVLFINGIPVVVVECKSPNHSDPEADGIEQLQIYSNQRNWLDDTEGNEALFHTNAFMVHTHWDKALVGTICSDAVHFKAWKDTTPVDQAKVLKDLGVSKLSSQQMLIAGMLRPEHLLDIIRHFVLFMDSEGKTIKVLARYQQFRAVHLAMQRLRTGKTKREDGEDDRRGGVIWHTQGSGKSLTMVFLIRRMRSDPRLRKFKVVVVTDRTSLQRQLSATAALSGEPVTVCKKAKQVRKVLAKKGPGVVFAMVQKYRDAEDEDAGLAEDETFDASQALNDDETILVMVDEAHRSHTDTLHMNLMTALPNCARIGFTGTPIIMGAKKKTTKIFGTEIDRYTIRQAEIDGATVPIIYESRTAKGAVADGRDLDDVFEDMLAEYTDEELERIKKKYATKGNVLESREMIRAKAQDMLRHYIADVLPNGFKAQVVAYSRAATLKYREAFIKARDELVSQLVDLEPAVLELDDEQAESLPRKRQFLRDAHPHLQQIRELEFCPIISAGVKDPEEYAEWTDPGKVKKRTKAFKLPFTHKDPVKRSPIAFLIVKSMLLTGFDAPIEQVLYLDRNIKEAELLQAIARVNRTRGKAKRRGLVVDYYGVLKHLKEALKAYTKEEVEGAMESATSELPKLRDQHIRLRQFFAERGLQVSGHFSPAERQRIAQRFGTWQHPRVSDPERAAVFANARRCVELLESLMLAPMPQGRKDPYPKLHQRVVSAVRTLLDESQPSPTRDQAADTLVLQVEPVVYKLMAVVEPVDYQKLAKKKKGLDTGLLKLRDADRSPYTLKLSHEQFIERAGWDARTSYENAVRDVVGDRLEAAHKGAGAGATLWPSTIVMLLGLVNHNLEALAKLPPAVSPDGPRADQQALELLQDEKLRAEFNVKLQQFLGTLDTVLPRPDAKPFVKDAKHYSALFARARRLYRGSERPIGKEVGEKVRRLIDEHVVSLGITPEIAPINLLDANFGDLLDRAPSDRAKASEMEHALRHHIRQHMDEDPEHYQRLSERLEEILEKYKEDQAKQVEQLQLLTSGEQSGRQQDDTGLDPKTQAPFYGKLAMKLGGREALSPEQAQQVKQVTIAIVEHIKTDVGLVEIWDRGDVIKALRARIFVVLDDSNLFDYDDLEVLADDVMALAKANHHNLVA